MSGDLKKSRGTHVTGDRPESYERFEHGPFSLEYFRFGSGPRPILAFHGFGRRAEDFALFAPYLRPDTTLYSFNLFGHGRSRYPSDRIDRDTISKREFAELISSFLDRVGAEKASLLAYSLGGKLALSLIERIPERIEGAYLFAPDGLTNFQWYRWASRIPFVRRLFRHFIHHPKGLFKAFHLLASLGLIHRRTARFLQRQAWTVEQRRAVYAIWNMHRDLGPDLKKVRKRMRAFDIDIRMIFGEKDPVIRPQRAWNLLDPKKERGKVHVLRKGHVLLDLDTVKYVFDKENFEDPLKIL